MPDRIRVCIADANEQFTDFFSKCMSRYPDIEIACIAKNIVETMEALSQTNPDLLLLNIVMPEMDGLQVLEQLNTMEGHKPPVFVLAATGKEAIINRAVHLGAEYYFIKPFTCDSIVARIRSFFRKR